MKTDENNTPSNSEPTPQQRDSVLTPEQTPPWSWGITLVLVAVVSLLIFAGFYFGIINV
ncbi:hypothetical protein [Aliterella atlantica]|nr:hypothetical protein [Aliterella atlantica]